MAASAGKRNVGAPNYDDDTTIRVEGDDKAGIEAIQAGDADAEKVNAQVDADDKDFDASNPDPEPKEDEIPVEEQADE